MPDRQEQFPSGRFEHSLSPDPDVSRWQRLTEPLFQWAFEQWASEGCHVTRDIPTLMKGGRIRDRTDGDRLPRPVSKISVILLLGRSAPPDSRISFHFCHKYRRWATRPLMNSPHVNGTVIASISSQALNSFLGNDGTHN